MLVVFDGVVVRRPVGATRGLNQDLRQRSITLGKEILDGKVSFEDAEKWILENGLPKPKSARQEFLENILNDYI